MSLHIPDPAQTGFIKVKGHSIYFEVYGDIKSGQTPLVAAHGGPGSSHNYLLPLSLLSSQRAVVLYDQLGTGRSQIPQNDRLYRVDYFVYELDQVFKQLKLNPATFLGHSWGGMLAIEYMKKRRPHIEALVLSSAIIDSQLYTEQAAKLLAKINRKYPKLAQKHELAGTTGSHEYQKMYKEYEKRHLFRGGERDPQFKSFNKNTHQYNKMWGPSEVSVYGSLKNWSGLKVLPTIKQPTLVISGKYDEVTPEHHKKTVQLLPNAVSKIIPGASHLAFLEKTGLYLKAVREFLAGA